MKRSRVVRSIAEKTADVEEVRRSAQAAADSASRLTVVMQRNQRTQLPAAAVLLPCPSVCLCVDCTCSLCLCRVSLGLAPLPCYALCACTSLRPCYCSEERKRLGAEDPAADLSEQEAVQKSLRRQREAERSTAVMLEDIQQMEGELRAQEVLDRDLDEVRVPCASCGLWVSCFFWPSVCGMWSVLVPCNVSLVVACLTCSEHSEVWSIPRGASRAWLPVGPSMGRWCRACGEGCGWVGLQPSVEAWSLSRTQYAC
jgi:hypothetical protein